MIAIFADTHRTEGHGLVAEALAAARDADAIVHAGDFKTESVLDAFQAFPAPLFAVAGNVDEPGVEERLPTERTVCVDGVRIALRHRPDGGETALALFGRERDADVVVFGHSHRPTLVETDDVVLCNPGSHAQPRGFRPGFATLSRENGRLHITIREPDGTVIEDATRALDDR
ncbi:YfcE family phosphodiesterase [Halovivax cerinus]|uniref:Phosphoesterase n=1 Tax=Halovivax cerinus TaxID=1487865 RepID=A0ABD5NL24_9EURY|nr:metallophosphoesterase [Halovivax cerinus]